MPESLIERSELIKSKIDLDALKNAGVIRDKNRYFLNVSYPSLQAMKPITIESVFSNNKLYSNTEKAVTLYVHIPFCRANCSYCHYYKIFNPDENIVNPYLEALGKEIELYKSYLNKINLKSVYIGGGTPSYLDKKQIKTLFKHIFNNLAVTDKIEITFEVHPEDATKDLFSNLIDIGVNRINLGVESFDNDILKAEHRLYTKKDAINAYKLAIEAGFDNINLDFIYGLKNQTPKKWQEVLLEISSLRPASFCAYYLRLKQGTLDYRHYLSHPESFPLEEELLLMQIMTFELMDSIGYIQDPVNWFIRDGSFFHEYQQHNWQKSDEIILLGIGVSALTYINSVQYYSINDVSKYIELLKKNILPIWKGEFLSNSEERMRRILMLGLKTKLSRKYFSDTYGVDAISFFAKEFDELVQLELIEFDKDFISLTYKGKLFADEVGQKFYSDKVRKNMFSIDPTLISTFPPFNPS